MLTSCSSPLMDRFVRLEADILKARPESLRGRLGGIGASNETQDAVEKGIL
jgi:hypothetical protein